MPYLFTSESVSEGHPDKVADQISDALIDHFLAFDPQAKVACETLVTTGQVVLAGEVKTNTYIDVQKLTRDVIRKIGYTRSEYMFEANSCGILSAIHEQSADIRQGVERKNPEDQGAGDQGMMFGYATRETDNYMPLALDLAHKILIELADIRKEGKIMTYLRPDAKSQVTIEYSDTHQPQRIDTIVVSIQHDDFDEDEIMLAKIKEDVINMNLDGLFTRTTVSFQPSLPFDELIINGHEVVGKGLDRVSYILDLVREKAGIKINAEVMSENNFPAGAGIASSAAAFAALALAASKGRILT